MTSTFPHKLKRFILKGFQKHLDKEPPIDGEKLTIKNYFYFFHITDVEERFDKLLIEGDIKAINDYLFLNLYIIKFFRTVRHDEDETRETVEKMKTYELTGGHFFIYDHVPVLVNHFKSVLEVGNELKV